MIPMVEQDVGLRPLQEDFTISTPRIVGTYEWNGLYAAKTCLLYSVAEQNRVVYVHSICHLESLDA